MLHEIQKCSTLSACCSNFGWLYPEFSLGLAPRLYVLSADATNSEQPSLAIGCSKCDSGLLKQVRSIVGLLGVLIALSRWLFEQTRTSAATEASISVSWVGQAREFADPNRLRRFLNVAKFSHRAVSEIFTPQFWMTEINRRTRDPNLGLRIDRFIHYVISPNCKNLSPHQLQLVPHRLFQAFGDSWWQT